MKDITNYQLVINKNNLNLEKIEEEVKDLRKKKSECVYFLKELYMKQLI